MEDYIYPDNIKTLKKIAYNFELISTAYHEAAHTLFSILYLMNVTSVYVYETNNRMGGFTHVGYFTYKEFKDPDLFNFCLYSDIYMIYSGLVAETTLYKTISGVNKLPMVIKSGSCVDINDASNLFRKYKISIPGRKRLLFKRKIIKHVSKILDYYWDDIKLISFALIEKKKLSNFDLKNLLSKKSKNKEFWKNQFKLIEYFYKNFENIDEFELKSTLVQLKFI